MPFKELLNAIHDTVRFIGHVCLIPVIAVLKAIDSCAQHLITEFSKV